MSACVMYLYAKALRAGSAFLVAGMPCWLHLDVMTGYRGGDASISPMWTLHPLPAVALQAAF